MLVLCAMKQYVVDELRPGDYRKIKSFLDDNLGSSSIPGLYRLPIESGLLTDMQTAHTSCRPFYFAIDLEPDRMSSELLVRADGRIRCSCMDYASERQRNWLIHFTDRMLTRLEISIRAYRPAGLLCAKSDEPKGGLFFFLGSDRGGFLPGGPDLKGLSQRIRSALGT